MAFDFPNAPSEGTVFGPPGGPIYVYTGGVWRMQGSGQVVTAETRSRIVNGAMQVSQQIGDAAGTGSTNFYADEWQLNFVGQGTITGQRVQVPTPNGSQNRLRVTVTAAEATFGATDHLFWQQNIEGIRVADFKWGTAAARQVVLRFGFKAPAGTYSVSIINDAAARSYVASFTIAAGQANTDTEQVFVIPGDTTGVYPVGAVRCMILNIEMAPGSTYQGAAGWQAGAKYGTSASTNGGATAGAVYELFDVGLYLDPNATGVPPPWQMPDEAAELLACQRYWQKGITAFAGTVTNATTTSIMGWFPEMRIGPAIATVNAGATAFAATASSVNNVNTHQCQFYRAATATGGGAFSDTWIASARM
jgi:hypothetical protein